MTTFIIALFITCFIILICKGDEWLSKESRKRRTKLQAKERRTNNNVRFIDNAIDNRGYEPYDGLVQYQNGVYSTIIFGNKDYPITRYLNADSIDELQKLADPLLEKRRDAWIRRRNKRGRK